MTGVYPNLRIQYGFMYRGALRSRINGIGIKEALLFFGKFFCCGISVGMLLNIMLHL